MLQIKVSEATLTQLDWMVGKCEYMRHSLESDFCGRVGYAWDYSTNWAKGGPIIEREEICVLAPVRGLWRGRKEGRTQYGPTPLIAAMRCYVASKLGDTIEVPEEI